MKYAKPFLLLALLATPLSAQVVDTMTTTTTTVIPRVRQAQTMPAPIVNIHTDSLAAAIDRAVAAGASRDALYAAIMADCGCNPAVAAPGRRWWFDAGLLALGATALIVWSSKETVVITNTNEQSQSQNQSQETEVITTVRRFPWHKPWRKKHGGHGK